MKPILRLLTAAVSLIFLFTLAISPINIQAAPSSQEPPPPPEIREKQSHQKLPGLDGVFEEIPLILPISGANVFDWSKLVYESLRNFDNYDVYIADGNGTNEIQLTTNSADDADARTNRGCTLIAFASDRDGDAEIYTMNLNGTGVTKRTSNSTHDFNPAWSPDGSKIAFQSYRSENQSDIYVMNANGTSQTVRASNLAWDGDPTWSPDGTKIAFASTRGGQYGIWVMNADGSNLTQLISQLYAENPAWSPDGSMIAYDADGNNDYWQELYVMNANGTNPHLVYDPPEYQTDGFVRSWSPDGRYITFTRVAWVYYNGDYYWDTAYLDAWDLNSSIRINLSNNGNDWHPDLQTCDNLAPVSSLNNLPAYSSSSINLSWQGSDQGLAGVRSYDIQVRDGLTGVWVDWMNATPATNAVYTGANEHTYYFRSRARDNAYNLEPYPADNETSTTVDGETPTSALNPLPVYSPSSFVVSWQGNDAAGSGLQSFDIQYRIGPQGVWTDWQINTIATSAIFNGTTGNVVYFRSRARDNVNNLESWPGTYDSMTVIDADFPSSAVVPLDPFSPSNFTVYWSGIDIGGSGLASYDIQYNDGLAGSWVDWQVGTSATSAGFTGINAHTYFFRSRSRDNATNLEAWPPTYDALTTVDSRPPNSWILPLPAYSPVSASIQWFGSDDGSGIGTYDVQFRDSTSVTWTDWLVGSPLTGSTFTGNPGHTYAFRVRATDHVLNQESWPAGNGDAQTTLYTWKVNGSVKDNSDTPVSGANLSSFPDLLNLPVSDLQGLYSAYGAEATDVYTLTIQKDGYANIPATPLDAGSDTTFDFIMPPVDNIVQNWGFETGLIEPQWTGSGLITPTIASQMHHTGQFAALLGEVITSTNATVSGDSMLTQAITLPFGMSSPVLSFLADVKGEPSQANSWFEVKVQEGITTTTLLTMTRETDGWTHFWHDLSPWAGETITLTLNLHQTAGQPGAWAYLDEVTIGAAHPDLWVEKSGPGSAFLPGDLITYTITYGNRGSIAASQVVLTDTLPAQLAFVSASVIPDSTTSGIVWEVGDLPAGSGPFTITVSVRVISNPAQGYFLPNKASISGLTPELEMDNNLTETETFIGARISLPLLVR
jgi:uncharacterized repeat protein (TIGR01451 family)